MKEEGEVALACLCEVGIGDLPRSDEPGVFFHVLVFMTSGGVGIRLPFLRECAGCEKGVDGDKVDRFVEDGVGKCADGELGRDERG